MTNDTENNERMDDKLEETKGEELPETDDMEDMDFDDIPFIDDEDEDSEEPDEDAEPPIPIRFCYAGLTPWFEDVKGPLLDTVQDEDLIEIQKMVLTLCYFLPDGKEGLDRVHLAVENDPEGEEVSWRRTEDGYAIRLCTDSGKNWCQVAYQLGYLLMRCMIDHAAPEDEEITWAEELVSEAAAIKMVSLLTKNWERTPFFKKDRGYESYLWKYLEMNLSDDGTSALLRCGSREELAAINERNDFADRIDESHDLYHAMDDSDFGMLAKIREFAADSLLFHTHYWSAYAHNCWPVRYLFRLQNRIPGCEIPAGISHKIHLENARPGKEQIRTYVEMIRSMSSLPGEYMIFSFLDAKKDDCEQIGVVFFQVTREKNGSMDMEVRIDTEHGRTMYRRYGKDEDAIRFLTGLLESDDMPDVEGWEDITDRIFFDEDEDQSVDDEEVFPGISLAEFCYTLEMYLDNPHWNEYYETAPSVECKTFIALEFYNSYKMGEKPEVHAEMKRVEGTLTEKDWMHLDKYCPNNPRKITIRNAIMNFRLKDQFSLLTDLRNHPENYRPVIDHVQKHFEYKTENGEVNIGWNIGLLDGNRPWFAECWATDGITMLTYFISAEGMEDADPDRLISMLQDAGIVKFSKRFSKRNCEVTKFTDSHGDAFFSVNIAVGDDENVYLEPDSGIVYPFRELDRFNKNFTAQMADTKSPETPDPSETKNETHQVEAEASKPPQAEDEPASKEPDAEDSTSREQSAKWDGLCTEPCCIFSEPDPETAIKRLEYDFKPVWHWKGDGNHVWDDGYRTLLRCRNCGGLVLHQHSTAEWTDDCGCYDDYVPVDSLKAAWQINSKYKGMDFESRLPLPHLRRTNGTASWDQAAKEYLEQQGIEAITSEESHEE